MRMVQQDQGREKIHQNHPESSNNYLQLNLKSALDFARTELAYKIRCKVLLGRLNVFYSLCARHRIQIHF